MANKTWLERLEATRVYQSLRYVMNRDLVNFFAREAFDSGKGLKIAEVACGSGFASHLIARHPNVSLSIAADLNLEDYDQARISDFKASFLLMDMFLPAIKASSLDFVWNSSSIEEIDKPEKAIKSMAGLVRPGGLVFIGVPSRGGPAGWLRRISGVRTKAWIGRVYSSDELGELVQSTGLTVKKLHTYLFGIFIGVLAQKSG